MKYIKYLYYFIKELIFLSIFILFGSIIIKEAFSIPYEESFLIIFILYSLDIFISYTLFSFNKVFKKDFDKYNLDEYIPILKSLSKKAAVFPVGLYRIKKENNNNAFAQFGSILIEGCTNENPEEKEFTIAHELCHVVRHHWIIIHFHKRILFLTNILKIGLKFYIMPWTFVNNIFLKIILIITNYSSAIQIISSYSGLKPYLIPILYTIILYLVFQWYLREKEYEADTFAAKLVGNKGGIHFFKKMEFTKWGKIVNKMYSIISTHPENYKRIQNLKLSVGSNISYNIFHIKKIFYPLSIIFIIFFFTPNHPIKKDIIKPTKNIISYYTQDGYRSIASQKITVWQNYLDKLNNFILPREN